MTILAIAVLIISLGACTSADGKLTCINFGGSDDIGLANPASVYCKGLGYDLEIRMGEGGESGYCIFPDGSECEEWSFLRGQCGQKYTFCERSGNRIESRTEEHDDMTATYGMCILKDSTECREMDFAQCMCP